MLKNFKILDLIILIHHQKLVLLKIIKKLIKIRNK